MEIVRRYLESLKGLLTWLVIYLLITLYVISCSGCKAPVPLSRTETVETSTEVRDTIVTITERVDTFYLPVTLRDTIVISRTTEPTSANLRVFTDSLGARLIVSQDAYKLVLDSVIKAKTIVRVVKEVNTVNRCTNGFHTFAVWLSVIVIAIFILVQLVRALPLV